MYGINKSTYLISPISFRLRGLLPHVQAHAATCLKPKRDLASKKPYLAEPKIYQWFVCITMCMSL